MTNMIITAFLCAWAIAALVAITFIHGADERRAERRNGSTQLGVKS